MEEVLEFIKKSRMYFLATVEGDQPRVRPFGSINIYNGKLYIQTGKVKDVSKQIAANPKVELCAMSGMDWVRIKATLVEDEDIEAQKSMLDAFPQLLDRYQAGDGNCQVFYLTDATATFFNLGAVPPVPPRVIAF